MSDWCAFLSLSVRLFHVKTGCRLCWKHSLAAAASAKNNKHFNFFSFFGRKSNVILVVACSFVFILGGHEFQINFVHNQQTQCESMFAKCCMDSPSAIPLRIDNLFTNLVGMSSASRNTLANGDIVNKLLLLLIIINVIIIAIAAATATTTATFCIRKE